MKNNEHEQPRPVSNREDRLCQRTGRLFRPAEHARCPYCFGTEAEIRTGPHEEFCDYRAGVDPPSFGFPADIGRHASG